MIPFPSFRLFQAFFMESPVAEVEKTVVSG